MTHRGRTPEMYHNALYEQVIPTPAYLGDVYAAAWPVAGITTWRYVRPLIILLCSIFML
jgi:NADPH:quinone reductase-like Zn-dependent oxidoreductase